MAEHKPAPVAARTVDGIRVGIGGWTYAPWRSGVFYPGGLAQRRELEYASRRLTAIEINGTFYRTQKAATYAKWRDESPDGFVFSVKAPRRIVGARRLAATGAQVEDFIGGIAELGDRLGPLVWQFESGLDHDDFAAFLELLPKQARGRKLRHVLDVRVPAFVDQACLALARRHGMAMVFTDSLDHPSFADVTADFVYARLMRSRPDCVTGYNEAALTDWARRAREWASGEEPADLPRIGPRMSAPNGPRDVFVFFIGAAKARNPAAAMALLQQLAE